MVEYLDIFELSSYDFNFDSIIKVINGKSNRKDPYYLAINYRYKKLKRLVFTIHNIKKEGILVTSFNNSSSPAYKYDLRIITDDIMINKKTYMFIKALKNFSNHIMDTNVHYVYNCDGDNCDHSIGDSDNEDKHESKCSSVRSDDDSDNNDSWKKINLAPIFNKTNRDTGKENFYIN